MEREEKSFREMVEEYRNNPDIEKMPGYKEGMKAVEKMDAMTKRIIHTVTDFINDPEYADDPEWNIQIYLAMAKATCYIIAGMEKTAREEGVQQPTKPLFRRYIEDLLPMSYEIVCAEIAAREKSVKEGYESDEMSEEERGKLRDIAKMLMNPDIPLEQIADEHFTVLTPQEREKAMEKLRYLREQIKKEGWRMATKLSGDR